jgi:hypothetical protein
MTPPNFLGNLSRRDFLKLSGAGLLSLWLSELRLGHALADETFVSKQGRVVYSGIGMYDVPSRTGKELKVFGRDEVVSITGEVTGVDPNENSYNPTWYRIGEDGYAYSGWIQPVQTAYNRPRFDIPQKGVLAEVTVPYTLAHPNPSLLDDHSSRLYYGATYWVVGIVVDREEKSIWYQIYDEFWQDTYYAAAQDLRIVPDEELTPIHPEIPAASKHIYVDLHSQTVVAYEDDQPVLTARCASGVKGSTTPPGEWKTFHKGASVHMADGLAGDSDLNYDLSGVPWVGFFTTLGHSFHGTYWHNNFGTPMSHGCVNLNMEDAKFLYLWTQPVVPPDRRELLTPDEGTAVQVVGSES